eukprot:6798690-Pyramimonas_sp.AAC.1
MSRTPCPRTPNCSGTAPSGRLGPETMMKTDAMMYLLRSPVASMMGARSPADSWKEVAVRKGYFSSTLVGARREPDTAQTISAMRCPELSF